MKLLLTNDDGINAPGLEALEGALARWGEITVVAPDAHHSGCGHRVETTRGLALWEVAPRRFALDSTPADCTRVGLVHVAPETQWVMSGINDGGNLGVDVYMSGTVAAVREAVLLGKPGIAFSQYRQRKEAFEWSKPAALVAQVLDALLAKPVEPGAFWNVNFPDLSASRGAPQIVFCPLEPAHLPVHYELDQGRLVYKGRYHQRVRTPGSDVDVCFGGNISVTKVVVV